MPEENIDDSKTPEELQRENLAQARRADKEGFRFMVWGAVFAIAVTVGCVAVVAFFMMRMGI